MTRGPHKSFHLPESKPHFRPDKEFHTEHYKVELSLDFEAKSVSGSCTLRVVPLKSGLDCIRLDAVSLGIKEVMLDGEPVDHDYDGKTLVVPINGEPISAKTVVVRYDTVPKEGIYFVSPEEAFPDKEVQAWTHNEAEFARYWFPCYDHPNDKSTSEMVITVPKGFRVVSNGELLSVDDSGGSTTFRWKEDLPHPTYLTSFVAGKLGEMVQEEQGIKLQYYFPERERENVLRYFGETPEMIRIFGELTGMKYPYAKYSQTTVEDFIFGGMENFNATTLTTTRYPDAQSEEDYQSSYSTPQSNAVNLVAHELAHQWFGDLVTCADWSHAWLNEGFATYFQGLYLEKTKGVDALRWDLGARVEQYFEEDEKEYRRAIVDRDYVFPDDVFDNTTYEKGASTLHELRYILGDEAFFKGVADYLKRFSFDNADSHDLMLSMEKASGLSLERFFEQAVYRPGFPEIEIDYSWDQGSKAAILHVKQVQSHDDGTPVFVLPADVVFYVDGKRSKVRSILDATEQTLTFFLGEKPEIVEFDPEHWLLKKVRFEKDLGLLINQLDKSQDACSRAEAAKELGRMKESKAVPSLKAAALKEQFWEVRAAALVALGEIGTPEALEAIASVGLPKDRRARRGVAKALGFFKEEKARDSLVAILKSDESPYVRCEAALSLGKSWPEGAFPFLKDCMKNRSPGGTLAEACLEAMGSVKDEEVTSVIRERISYGNPTRVRIGAVKAIKGRGRILEEEVPVLKEILLRDKDFRVRLYLVNELIRHLGDVRFADTLKIVSGTDKDPRVRRKALDTYYELRTSADVSAAVAQLQAEVEELKEENRRLARKAGSA
jgi:aminopeptidase N